MRQLDFLHGDGDVLDLNDTDNLADERTGRFLGDWLPAKQPDKFLTLATSL